MSIVSFRVPEAGSPDAELIRICAQHVVNLHAYNNGSRQAAGRARPALGRMRPHCDLIGQTKAVSLEGMVAKGRAALVEAANCRRDSAVDPSGTPAEYWAWELVQDLLRLQAPV